MIYEMNPNVRLSLWWTVAENVSGSIRSGDALSAYIYLITQRNSVVGFVQGINGTLQLLVALPAGWAADKNRRDAVLRTGAGVGLLGGVALGAAMLSGAGAPAIAAAMALLGVYRGFYNPALEALFADSVQSGRTGPYTYRHVAMVLSSGAGPLLSLLVFLRLGDAWSVDDCRVVVCIGLVVMLPALAMMCFFDDDKAMTGREERRGERSTSEEVQQPLLLEEDGENEEGDGCLEEDAEEEEEEEGREERGWRRPTVAVPLFLTASDVAGALASGMTLKFFSLFFMQRAGLSPAAVSALSAAAPVGVAAASLAAQRAAKRLGRVQLSLFTRTLDIVLLIGMAKLPPAPGPARAALIAVHLLRMAVANCTRPLMRSVLNEFVAPRHRARVNAVDSIRNFSWSGSAALGGLLVERLGFETTFLVTAGVKVVAVLPLFVLIRYVPDGVGAGGRGAAAARAVAAPAVVARSGRCAEWSTCLYFSSFRCHSIAG